MNKNTLLAIECAIFVILIISSCFLVVELIQIDDTLYSSQDVQKAFILGQRVAQKQFLEEESEYVNNCYDAISQLEEDISNGR